MSTYGELIAEAIDRADAAMVALVEELMRAGRTALDGLTPEQFIREARLALSDALGLAAVGQLGFYCQTLGLEMPAIEF